LTQVNRGTDRGTGSHCPGGQGRIGFAAMAAGRVISEEVFDRLKKELDAAWRTGIARPPIRSLKRPARGWRLPNADRAGGGLPGEHPACTEHAITSHGWPDSFFLRVSFRSLDMHSRHHVLAMATMAVFRSELLQHSNVSIDESRFPDDLEPVPCTPLTTPCCLRDCSSRLPFPSTSSFPR
jgi:hypothetical protein